MSWPAQIGSWHVGAKLGSGGSAEVRLGVATSTTGQRVEVALKRPVRAGDAALEALLRCEAGLLAKLRHPNIVSYVDFVADDPPVLVLEVMHGRTLAEHAAPTLTQAIAIVGQAASALAAVHAAADHDGPLAAVHRDVSPANLFILDDGKVKLFDFNVACWRDHAPPLEGVMQGRVAYMAPEQARGEAVDDRADVFSLGVVLWELLIGERLFWRGNTLASLRALMDEPVAKLAERRPGLPAELTMLADRMLARDRAQRPAAAEVEASLRGLASSSR